MASRRKFTWWKRLLAVLTSIATSVAIGLLLVLLRDLKTDSDFHWGNAGEEQIVFFILFILRVPLLSAFLFIAPLAILTPINVQRRYWPLMVSVAALITLLLGGMFPSHSISQIFTEVRTEPWFFTGLELAVLSGCGAYVLFLRRFDSERGNIFESRNQSL
jgi:hypothetical protein